VQEILSNESSRTYSPGAEEGIQARKQQADMINGFDKETVPLSDYERETLLPIVANWLKATSRSRPIINKMATSWLRDRGYNITEARFRKIVSAIRLEAIVENVIATSKGYYVSDDASEIADYIQSLRERAGAITAVADALTKQGNKVEATLF
jgi:hypothetical protein